MSIRELINRSLEEIRQSLFDYLNAKQDEYAAKGWLPIRLNLNKGVVRGLIELWSWGLYQLYQFLAVVLRQAFPDTATGGWLDLHCKQVGVTRKAATKAVGTVYFTRTDTAGNVPISAGRIVKTPPDGTGTVYRFVTLEDVVLADGLAEVAVQVEAEEYGQGANVTVSQISEIVTVINGVDAVENRADWLTTEGADEELDDALRARYVLAWKGLNGCTKHAYESWALSVNGVVAAKILDQHPRGQGTVDVVIKGTAGLPTQTLLDAVDQEILGTDNDDEKQPVNDDVLVKAPTPVYVDVDIDLVLLYGTADEVVSEAQSRLRALFETVDDIDDVPPLEIGQDVPLDLLRWAVMSIDGVKQLTVTAPSADVTVDNDGLALLQSINVTSTWAVEA